MNGIAQLFEDESMMADVEALRRVIRAQWAKARYDKVTRYIGKFSNTSRLGTSSMPTPE